MAKATRATTATAGATATSTIVPEAETATPEAVEDETAVDTTQEATGAAVEVVVEAPEPTKTKTSRKATAVLKCSVNQALLKAALDRVRGSLPTKKSLPNPAIGLFRLVADRANRTLAITTYNEIVATTVSIPANVVIEGALLVSKDLADLISQLPDAGITLAAETPNRLQVIMENRTFRPNSMSAANYPDLLTDDGLADEQRFEVSASAFGRALEFVCPGALTEGADAEASIFNSVRLDLWQSKKGGAVFALASSDDTSLVLDESSLDATINRQAPQLTVTIPVKSLEILAKLLDEPEEDTVKIILHSGTGPRPTLCLFKCGGSELLTHLITAQWQDYLSHIPKPELFTAQVVADRQLLLSHVNCNLVFAIAKTFRTMMLELLAESGKISTWVKTQSKGESVQEMIATVTALNGNDPSKMKPFAFNAAQVKLALTLFSDTEICWQFISSAAPTLVSGGTKGRCIILMPISVTDGDEEEDKLPDTVEPTARKGKPTAK